MEFPQFFTRDAFDKLKRLSIKGATYLKVRPSEHAILIGLEPVLKSGDLAIINADTWETFISNNPPFDIVTFKRYDDDVTEKIRVDFYASK